METTRRTAIALFVMALAVFSITGLRAQTNDVPRIISYQGQVSSVNNTPLSGNHRVTVAFYSDREGTHMVWQGTYDAEVTGGVFNVLLGSGASPLPDAKTMNQTLYVGTTLDNGLEMRPLSQLSGSPFAMTIPDKSVTKEKIAADYVGGISVNGKKITGNGTSLNLTDGHNAYLNFDEKTNSISLNSLGGLDSRPQAVSWDQGGNSLSATSSTAVGSTNANAPVDLEFWIRGNTVMRYTNRDATVPNIIGGYVGNSIDTFIRGGTISGGGGYQPVSGTFWSNTVTSDFATIGGGAGNYAGSNGDIHREFQTVGGGVKDTATGDDAVIAGGEYGVASGSESAILGGSHNIASGDRSVAVGGYRNLSLSVGSFAGGGDNNGDVNNIASDTNCVVAGGKRNEVHSSFSSLVRGRTNFIDTLSDFSFVGGGELDSVIDTAVYSVVAGGHFNRVRASYNVIAGGDSNLIDRSVNGWNASYSFIGGGLQNVIDSASPYNVVAGGLKNFNGGGASMIGGGVRNLIFDNSIEDFIGAGRGNYIGNETRTALGKGINYSSIVGGDSNVVAASWSTIVGGKWDTISDAAEYSFLGGGFVNHIRTDASMSFIGGGDSIEVRAPQSAIAGGHQNLVDIESRYGIIGGGIRNAITEAPLYELKLSSYPPEYTRPMAASILGGCYDTAFGHSAAIGGGSFNRAYGFAATIPGGLGLKAYDWQTVIGLYNWSRTKHLRNFGTPDPFKPGTAPDPDDPIFIVGAGFSDEPTERFNAFEVTEDGRSAVFKENGTGGASPGIPASARKGSTYTDNVIYAWATVHIGSAPSFTITSTDFGVQSITRIRKGVYKVRLNLEDQTQDPPVPYNLSSASITATVIDNTNLADTTFSCGYVNVSDINQAGAGPNEFIVRTHDLGSGCPEVDMDFMFKVTGR